jgi:hypothetical protein
MHSLDFKLWDGNLVPLCLYSQEEASDNPKQMSENNHEPFNWRYSTAALYEETNIPLIERFSTPTEINI